MSIIKQIVKRDGTTVAYDRDRIGTAAGFAYAALVRQTNLNPLANFT